MLRLLKEWTLPFAMLAGVVGHQIFSHLAFLTPYLIFTMLLLTFCSVSTSDLKLKPYHWWLLAIQITGSIIIYATIAPLNKIVAEATLICIMAPTATSAAVITHKLGGSAASVSLYTLLSNICLAFAAPIVFPFIELHPDMGFWQACFIILRKVFPILILPFITVLFLRNFTPKIYGKLLSIQEFAFYLWAVALAVVSSQIFESLTNNPGNLIIKIIMGTTGLIACAIQFFIGKNIGSKYGDRISAGQALGQKNTILAIWMAQTYLNPLSSVGPGSYVLWQNLINSLQLWRKQHHKKDL